jgi:A118 family predicted phage portal protein|nr:MAG TPA: portal protein [Bacteriophage sp.]
MEVIFEFLQKRGYNNISQSYYSYINKWTNIWQGKAEWLNIKTVDNKEYPMYSLGMAKRVCEDLASTITSEPFTITAKKNNEILQEDLKKAKVLKKLPAAIEIMGYSGTVGTVTRIKNAIIVNKDGTLTLTKTNKTKIQTIDVKANQIIPLTIEDGEIIDCAIVSKQKRLINNKIKDVYYLELHELKEKGYQITNKFFIKEDGTEIKVDGVIGTYNTLSNVPLFSLGRINRVNPISDNNGLGISLFGDSIDQLIILDLVYNNFGMDFKLGQKLMLINKKLTRVETEEYTDKNGNLRTREHILYPSDIRKQQFMEIGNELMDDGTEKPYIFEYNPDLRVGDNKEGVQFALDNLSFKVGFGTHYYSFENGNIMTATEAILSNKDFVNNGRKNRKAINEYLIGICRALLLCEKMLGNKAIDEKQEIEIAEVDGFLEDDSTIRQRAKEEVSMGLMSKKRYLRKVYGMSEEEAIKELKAINEEDEISNIEFKEGE